MERSFDVLFSFQFAHDVYHDAVTRDFRILPTSTCRAALARHGMGFKSFEEGGQVIVEKISDGLSPAQALRPLRGLTAFPFIIQAVNKSIIPQTRPYSETGLRSYTGKSRILYLDNLNNANVIDTSPQLSVGAQVGQGDLGSLIPNEFSFQEDPADIQQVRIEEIQPGGSIVQTVPITPNQTRVELDLKSGAYRLIKLGIGSDIEVIYAESGLLGADLIAIVQIYKDETVDYNTPVPYTISFQN
ncbi:MAG: hypothetical protein AAF587_15050 [Bacteroidota bacterium]